RSHLPVRTASRVCHRRAHSRDPVGRTGPSDRACHGSGHRSAENLAGIIGQMTPHLASSLIPENPRSTYGKRLMARELGLLYRRLMDACTGTPQKFRTTP